MATAREAVDDVVAYSGWGSDNPTCGAVGQSPIFGAGVFPHAGAGGQEVTEPTFMPSIAASILIWMSVGSLVAAS